MTTLREAWVGMARESAPHDGVSPVVLWAALRMVTERIGGPWTHDLPPADPSLPTMTVHVADGHQSILFRPAPALSAASVQLVAAASARVTGLRDVPFRLVARSSCGGHVTD